MAYINKPQFSMPEARTASALRGTSDHTPAISPSVTESVQTLVQAITAPEFSTGFTPSPYETLYVAAADFPKDSLKAGWHEQILAYLTEVSQQQHEDGSWGSDSRLDYVPDRVITTLMTLYSLWKYNLLTEDHICKAGYYLQFYLPGSIAQNTDKLPIAYEALTIEHLRHNHEAGITVDFNFPFDLNLLVQYRNLRMTQKAEMLYLRPATIHSVLDGISSVPNIQWEFAAAFQEHDGSMGIYASSTAALLAHLAPDSDAFQRGIDYLNNAMTGQGEFLPFYPADAFERWWALLPLAQSPVQAQVAALLPATHKTAVPREGIAVSLNFSLPDVDTSAMKAAALLSLGIDCDLAFLETFYHAGVFRCYEREERTSPSANIHALMAVAAWSRLHQNRLPEQYRKMVDSALDYLLEEEGDHYEDKWHLSDLYTTSHALELFASLLPLDLTSDQYQRVMLKLCAMLEYVLGCRRQDGGFGTQGFSTVEETGYAGRALCAVVEAGIYVAPDALSGALAFLEGHDVMQDPPLWLGKTLYRSIPLAQAQQLSALAWLETLV